MQIRKTQIKKDFNWLAGLVDGDGTFSFSLNKKEKLQWNCTFKVGASLRNARLLRHCHQLIGYGSVNLKSGKDNAEFRIRDRKILRRVIIPLFEKHPLWTRKAFYFQRWCAAMDIMDSDKDKQEKHTLLKELKEQSPPKDYRAPAWQGQEPQKAWVCGFVEAGGSFFIFNKGGVAGEKMVHAFGITQKLDENVLQWIGQHLRIPTKVECRNPERAESYYSLETSNRRVLCHLGQYFRGQFWGRKSLEHRIWQRTFKWRGHQGRLRGAQELLRTVRAVPHIPPTLR